MRIQIVPRGIEIEEQPDGGRIIRMMDAAAVEVAVGPIPAEKWADFVAYVNDPQAAKERQQAAARLITPPGVPRL